VPAAGSGVRNHPLLSERPRIARVKGRQRALPPFL
jgi:hypothetical protein